MTDGKQSDSNDGDPNDVSQENVANADGYPESVPSVPCVPSQDEKPMFHNLPEMPEDPEEDGLEVVSEKDLKPQESFKSFNPIISVEDFFSDDMPLPTHRAVIVATFRLLRFWGHFKELLIPVMIGF